MALQAPTNAVNGCVYSVAATSVANGNGQANITLNYSAAPPVVPSGCSISGAPGGSVAAGTQVTLTINCTSGGTANAWSWTSGSNATTQTIGPITVNTTTTFTAKASADGGTTWGTSASATVNIGGGGGNISCSGFAATHVISVTWGSTSQTLTSQNGGFGPNDALVLKFTTPANGATLLRKGSVSGAEYLDSSASRYGTLSTVACDFAGTNAPTITGTSPPQQQVFCFANQNACSTNISFGFTFNPLKTGAALLLPNTTYYINLGNWHQACTNGSCNMIFNWSWVTS